MKTIPTEGVGLGTPRKVRYDYAYDGFNRLISAKGESRDSLNMDIKKYKHKYSYSQNGNLMSKDILDFDTESSIDRWDYEYSNHAATSVNTTQNGIGRFQMEYDAAGNMTYERDNNPPNPPEWDLSPAAKRMEYDSSNRIVKVTNPDTGDEVIGKYWYDDQGFRVAKISRQNTSDGKKEYEVFYPTKYLCMEIERDLSGNEIPGTYTVANNIYLNGQRIAVMLPSGEAQYYLTDQVDSVKLVVDDHAKITSSIEYKPYGETWYQEGANDFDPRFNGQELDRESGLYFYNSRHYDPEISRFVSPDTVVDGALDTQGWNRYAYCKNNPIDYADPTGHNALKKIGKDIKRAVIDSVTYKYTYKDGGAKGVFVAIHFPGGPCGIRYSKTNGWSVRSEVVNYYGAHIGWGWQQKGYHKGFNVFTGGGYNWGYLSVGGSGTYYFGSKTMSHYAGLSVGNKYGSVGVGYTVEHDMNGNIISNGWVGTGEVNKAGIAMEQSGLNQHIRNLEEGKGWDGNGGDYEPGPYGGETYQNGSDYEPGPYSALTIRFIATKTNQAVPVIQSDGSTQMVPPASTMAVGRVYVIDAYGNEIANYSAVSGGGRDKISIQEGVHDASKWDPVPSIEKLGYNYPTEQTGWCQKVYGHYDMHPSAGITNGCIGINDSSHRELFNYINTYKIKRFEVQYNR